jgi:hypothetical protein
VYRRVFFRVAQSNICLRTIRVSVQWLYCTTISNPISSKRVSVSYTLLDYALAINSNSQHRYIEVHNSSRPHDGPHIGYPRGEGGKGFKTKNDMAIRHGLIRDSQGYHCPFCPYPAPRCPRPDNLQRYALSHPSLTKAIDS